MAGAKTPFTDFRVDEHGTNKDLREHEHVDLQEMYDQDVYKHKTFII
jgi:hypothetical protein